MARGRFKGKKVTFASTARVEEFAVLASEFMDEIFELLPREYAISDESDLLDFTDMGSSDTSELWKRINEVYGIELIKRYQFDRRARPVMAALEATRRLGLCPR